MMLDKKPASMATTCMTVDEVRSNVVQVLTSDGVPTQHAEWTADWLIDSDLRGVASHGLRQLPRYVQRMRHGGINPTARPHVAGGMDAAFVVDADNGLGPVGATWTMHELIDRAHRLGTATSSVFNGNHLGALAYLARMATDAGLVVFGCQNTRPTTAPWGGRRAAVGNAPIVWGLPRAEGHALILDVATSKVAGGTLKFARLQGEPITEGLALDEDGEPTTDPAAALNGALLPFGEHKGSGISIIAGALAGVVGYANVNWAIPHQTDYSRPRSLGYYLTVVNIEALLPLATYLDRIERYVADVRQGGNPGDVRIPGERSELRRRAAMLRGIDVEVPVLQLLAGEPITNVLDDPSTG